VRRASAALALSVLATVLVALPSAAHACWDGYAGEIPHVSVGMQAGSRTWSPDTARELAQWLVRIDALRPQGHSVSAWDGAVRVCEERSGPRATSCLGDDHWDRWDGRTFWSMFRAVALAVGAKPVAVRAALQRKATPFTVQVAVGYDERGARALARRFNQTHPADHGFYEAGGFPADNDVVHVMADRDDEGAPIFRVVVGAYLTRAEAQATVVRVRAAAGLQGFVRPL
jgi:hypothetical protein